MGLPAGGLQSWCHRAPSCPTLGIAPSCPLLPSPWALGTSSFLPFLRYPLSFPALALVTHCPSARAALLLCLHPQPSILQVLACMLQPQGPGRLHCPASMLPSGLSPETPFLSCELWPWLLIPQAFWFCRMCEGRNCLAIFTCVHPAISVTIDIKYLFSRPTSGYKIAQLARKPGSRHPHLPLESMTLGCPS